MIEPRNALSVRADALRWAEGHIAAPEWPGGVATSPGSERVACVRVGFPGTREASSSPS